MRVEMEIMTPDNLLTQDEVEVLLTTINSSEQLRGTGLIVRLPPTRIGEFASLDPMLWQIIVEVANVGALGVALKGFFDVITEWQRNRAQKIIVKAGEVSLEIPANASKEQISYLTGQVSALMRSLEADLKHKKKG